MDASLRVGQVAALADLSAKAVRGYEELGLVVPHRDDNGYRRYDPHQARAVATIGRLNALGIPLRDMGPFVDCLNSGSPHADDCPATLAEYRKAMDRIDRTVEALAQQRHALVASLSEAAARMIGDYARLDAANPNLAPLPPDLPEPADDGAADHLPGRRVPSVRLDSTEGNGVDLGSLGPGRTLIYIFPMTGAPERDMPDGWDSIPGARGCSTHNCDIRDHYVELLQAGVARVYGLSSQPMEYQRAVVDALRLPYPLLTDTDHVLAADPGLPTISAGELRLYRRAALIVSDGVIEHVFYPVFPPNRHASVVLDWLADHPVR